MRCGLVCVCYYIFWYNLEFIIKKDQKNAVWNRYKPWMIKFLLPKMLNGLYSNVKVPTLYLRVKKSFPSKTPIFSSSYILLKSHLLKLLMPRLIPATYCEVTQKFIWLILRHPNVNEYFSVKGNVWNKLILRFWSYGLAFSLSNGFTWLKIT